MSIKFVQTPAVTLYSGMSSADVTCKITPYPVDLDGNKLTIADFGDSPTFTVDPKVSGSEEINGFTGIIDNGDNTATLTGLTRNLQSKSPYTASSAGGKAHGASAIVVFSDNPQLFSKIIDYINGIVIAGGINASLLIQGVLQLGSTAQINAGTAIGSTTAPLAVTPDALAASIYGQQLPSATEKTFLSQYALGIIGVPVPTFSKTAPTGFVMYDGSAVSRTGAYANLFNILCPSGVVTMTSASPAVFTKTAHGYVAGERVHFTTTGGFYSGLAANTEYFVLSTGLTADTFRVALSPEGTAVNTSGSQSGVHTVYQHKGGIGDGTTTFNVPDMRSKGVIGMGQGTETLKFESGAVDTTNDWITIPSLLQFPHQGQAVVLTTTGGLPAGLSLATTYYVIRLTSTTIAFATSQANANAGTKIDLTTVGSGVATITYTNVSGTVLGEMGGEESHGISIKELADHTHNVQYKQGTSGGSSGGTWSGEQTVQTGGVTNGSGDKHNNLSPFIRTNWMAKY